MPDALHFRGIFWDAASDIVQAFAAGRATARLLSRSAQIWMKRLVV